MPRERVVFFLDRSVGRRFVREALVGRGVRVELHDDHFDVATPDEVWIRAVGERGWTILTRDRRIRHRPLERRAVIAARARLFAITAGNLDGPAMAELVVRHLRKMGRLAESEPPPWIAHVTRSRVDLWRLRG